MAQLEIFDGANWIQIASASNLSLTGAVLGSGVGTINTALNVVQTITSPTFDFNWNSPTDYYTRTNLMANSLPSSGGTFVDDFRSGDNNSNFRMWRKIYQPGSETGPGGYFYLQYLHNQLSQVSTYLKVTAISGSFVTEIEGAITMNGSHINGVGYPNVGNQAANKTYVDTVASSTISPITSLINLATFGFVVKTASNTYNVRSLVAGNGISITNTNGVVGNPTISTVDKAILHAGVTSGYSTNIAGNDHIKFATNIFTRGTGITLDRTTTYTTATNVASLGRITLVANKTYKLTGYVAVSFSSTTGSFLTTRWWNADTNATIGIQNTWYGGGVLGNSGTETISYFTPTVTTRIELRINGIASVTSIYGINNTQTVSWCTVEEV